MEPDLHNALVAAAKSFTGKKKEVSAFVQRYMGNDSARSDNIGLDHCYSKNWNSQSDQSHAQTAKYISWLNSEHRKAPHAVDDDEIVDIESVDNVPESQFDESQANILMTECERHMKIVRPASTRQTDEPIDRSDWTTAQNKVFNRVYKALAAARLSKLANAGSLNEPILRRLNVDKNARRIRHIFSSACWDQPLLSWLHSTCMDNLPNVMLSDYLEVLQTLKVKVPELIDRVITGSDHHQRMSSLCNKALDLLITRPWDPMTAMPSLTKLEKLPKNPLLVLVPQFGRVSGDDTLSANHHRHEMWSSQLSNMGRLLTVPAPDVSEISDRWEQFDAMVAITKACIIQAKETYPSKPIILLGWNFGALLAIYVSSMHRVNAVVALGYPLLGLSGLRGDADDVTVDSTTPILFVVGEHAQTCPIDDLENMRERMRAENELIVVAGANDKLNINFKTKKDRLLTQAIVDRCIQEEIHSYLERLLAAPAQLVQAPSLTSIERLKKKKSQALNLTGRKIITTIKRLDHSMISVPKKRKSPSKEGRAKKHMKIAPSAVGTLPSEQEQLAAISSITPASSAVDPLSLSSSSQGSLTSLKPHRLKVPNLSTSLDNTRGEQPVGREHSARQSYQGYRLDISPVQHFSAQVKKKGDTQSGVSNPTYIQLTGQHTGQGLAITMEKARELLSMGMLKNFTRSHSVDDSRLPNCETTRKLLSMPAGSTVTYTSTSPAAPVTRSLSVAEPISNSASQIRHLLSADGRLMLANATKSATNKEMSPLTTSHNPSPGQSLIRRLQSSASSTNSCRQILAKPQDAAVKRTISVVLNSSSNCPSTAATAATAVTAAVIINPNTKTYSNLVAADVTEQTNSGSSDGSTLVDAPVSASPAVAGIPQSSESPALPLVEHNSFTAPAGSDVQEKLSESNLLVEPMTDCTDNSEVSAEPGPEMLDPSAPRADGSSELALIQGDDSHIPSNSTSDIIADADVMDNSAKKSLELVDPEGCSSVTAAPSTSAPPVNQNTPITASAAQRTRSAEIKGQLRSSIDCLDNQVKEVLSANTAQTLTSSTNNYFADVDFPPHIVDDIIVPATSMFNPELEDNQRASDIPSHNSSH